MKSVILFLALLVVAAHAQSRQEIVEQLFKGVGEGFMQSSLPDVLPCVQDVEAVYSDVETAVKDFQKKTYDGVKDALLHIGDALERLADAMTRCKAGVEEVKKVIKVIAQLKNPKSFFVMIGKNLLLNGKEIWHETETAFGDWKNKQYEDAGKQIGYIISKLLGTGVQVARLDADVKVIEKLFLGILEGFTHQAIPSLETCIGDVAAAIKAFETAFHNFEKGTWDSVKEALQNIAQGLDILADAMTRCKAVSTDVQKLINALKQLKNPKTFFFTIGKNLLVNGKEIYGEIVAAHDAWKNQNYEESGKQIGYIVSKLLGTGMELTGLRDTPTVKKIEQLFAGILVGFEQKALPDIEPCLTDVLSAFNHFYAAFQDFEKKTYDGVRAALLEISQGLQSLADAMTRCKASVDDVKKLIQIIKTLADPKTLIWTIGKNLIVNGKEIFGEVSTAYTDWKNEDFFGAGQNIGYVISKLLGTGLEEALPEPLGDQPTSCGKASDHLKIESMSFFPDPPKKGQDIHINAKGALDEVITSGDAHIVVKYLGIKVIDQHEDLCKLVEQTGIKCPLAKGPLSLNITQNVPSSVPGGKYEAEATVADQKGEEVACIKVAFKI